MKSALIFHLALPDTKALYRVCQNVRQMFDLDSDVFKEKVLSIKGIGPWTAEYICLRPLGDTDAFPIVETLRR